MRYDKGGEFIGWSFQQLLTSFQVKNVTVTVKNQQSNTIYKHMHQMVGNILRTIMYTMLLLRLCIHQDAQEAKLYKISLVLLSTTETC